MKKILFICGALFALAAVYYLSMRANPLAFGNGTSAPKSSDFVAINNSSASNAKLPQNQVVAAGTDRLNQLPTKLRLETRVGDEKIQEKLIGNSVNPSVVGEHSINESKKADWVLASNNQELKIAKNNNPSEINSSTSVVEIKAPINNGAGAAVLGVKQNTNTDKFESQEVITIKSQKHMSITSLDNIEKNQKGNKITIKIPKKPQ